MYGKTEIKIKAIVKAGADSNKLIGAKALVLLGGLVVLIINMQIVSGF